jgi:hypothetical protein
MNKKEKGKGNKKEKKEKKKKTIAPFGRFVAEATC